MFNILCNKWENHMMTKFVDDTKLFRGIGLRTNIETK